MDGGDQKMASSMMIDGCGWIKIWFDCWQEYMRISKTCKKSRFIWWNIMVGEIDRFKKRNIILHIFR